MEALPGLARALRLGGLAAAVLAGCAAPMMGDGVFRVRIAGLE